MNGRDKLTTEIERLRAMMDRQIAESNYTAATILAIRVEATERARAIAFDGA